MTTLATEFTAKDVMTREPVCVPPSATIRQLARVLNENEISGAPVIDSQGRLIGMVSKTDLIRRCAAGIVDVPPAYMYELISEHRDEEIELIPEPLVCVDDFMTPNPATVTADTPAAEVARLMFERRIHRVVVTDRDQVPVGIITSLDLLGAFPQGGGSPPAASGGRRAVPCKSR